MLAYASISEGPGQAAGHMLKICSAGRHSMRQSCSRRPQAAPGWQSGAVAHGRAVDLPATSLVE